MKNIVDAACRNICWRKPIWRGGLEVPAAPLPARLAAHQFLSMRRE
jgi:hypothetical protein